MPKPASPSTVENRDIKYQTAAACARARLQEIRDVPKVFHRHGLGRCYFCERETELQNHTEQLEQVANSLAHSD